MRAALEEIAQGYPAARDQAFSSHALAQFIRGEAARQVQEAAGEEAAGLRFHGSPGQGGWAEVPWLAVFNPVVTTSATRGYYVVFLFSADMLSVALSMNQGTTTVRQEFGSRPRDVLRERATLIRERLPEHRSRFSASPIELHSEQILPRDYEAGHAFGKVYRTDALPGEDDLAADLREMIRMYLALTFRGGLDPTPEAEGSEDQAGDGTDPIVELRRYRYHRRIERSRTDAVKRVRGYRCEACEFDFEERYGPVGKGYIEAHHLMPLAQLPEGKPVSLDPVKDFRVLCANCHRMMHRRGAPDGVDALRELLR